MITPVQIGLRSFLGAAAILLLGVALRPTDPAPISTLSPRHLGNDELDALCNDCVDPSRNDQLLSEKLRRDQGLLTKGDIVWGMAKIKPSVAACYQGFPGLANVAVTIAPDGHVDSAHVSGSFAHTPIGACVENAVESARFPPSTASTSISYPFMLR